MSSSPLPYQTHLYSRHSHPCWHIYPLWRLHQCATAIKINRSFLLRSWFLLPPNDKRNKSPIVPSFSQATNGPWLRLCEDGGEGLRAHLSLFSAFFPSLPPPPPPQATGRVDEWIDGWTTNLGQGFFSSCSVLIEGHLKICSVQNPLQGALPIHSPLHSVAPKGLC